MFLTYGWLLWAPEILIGFVYGLFVRSWFLQGNKTALKGIPLAAWFVVTLALSQTQVQGLDVIIRIVAFVMYGVCYVAVIGGMVFVVAAVVGAVVGAFARVLYEGMRKLFVQLFLKP